MTPSLSHSVISSLAGLVGAAVATCALLTSSGCSSSSAPLQGDATASTDASMSSGDDGADAGPKDAGTKPASDGSLACGTRVDTNVIIVDAGEIECGTPCNLRTDTCCISALGLPTCTSGHNGCGGALAAGFECVEDTDCPSGQVCCGFAANSAAGSKCQDISGNGDKCSPAPSSTQGSVQFCQKTCECKDGSECIPQSCNVAANTPMAQLSMCGLQSQAPYNCTQR